MAEIYETVQDYRTEGEGTCDHKVTIRDCLLGLKMAFNHLPTLKLESFDVENLLWMEQPQNGDLNWIVPGKLLALAGPTDQNWSLQKFMEYAQSNSIGCLVRLNRPHYSAEELTRDSKIEHLEMFMHDGTNPTTQNVKDFIELVDRINSNQLAVAVHCRAGLGRTGTMIASYLLFQYARDSKTNQDHPLDCPCLCLEPSEIARAIVGFLRIMRPGSVLSGQPEFLESIASIVMKAGYKNDPAMIKSFDFGIESNEQPSVSIKVRFSKRIKMSTSSESLKLAHPISHAGRGHAAEKHSSVQLEKIQ